MADTVTISKEYFDTLLRRTQVQVEGTVTIPQHEFDVLLKSTQDYTTLRAALVKGGVDAATLDVLINGATEGSASHETTQQPTTLKPHPQIWSAQAEPFVPKTRESHHPTVHTRLRSDSYHDKQWQLPSPDSTNHEEFEELKYDGISSVGMVNANQQYGCGQDTYEQEEEDFYDINREDRSVILKGISPFTTMADVLAVIRGGAVLNIYLRPQQRTAHIAFVEPNAAEKFLIHSKRADVYIKGKRIEVFWDERQYFLPGYLARRIYNTGATRNIVVRFAKADMTDESIREDLDHIYRLEVVSIRFEFGHAWISLNSVQQAVTARSCMSSRFKYKGSRIEFYPDDCAEPLPSNTRGQPPSQPATLRSKSSAYNFNNRFATLTVDDGSHSSIAIGSPVMIRT